jgi:hypothetical protein
MWTAMATVGTTMMTPASLRSITQHRSFSNHRTMWKFSLARRDLNMGVDRSQRCVRRRVRTFAPDLDNFGGR